MKTKFNSDVDLALKKTVEFCNMIVDIRFAFHEDNKQNSEIFLDEYLYKL